MKNVMKLVDKFYVEPAVIPAFWWFNRLLFTTRSCDTNCSTKTRYIFCRRARIATT